MICNNCGAHFDDDLPKCPYCGDFHYAGAQKEYMDKLENVIKTSIHKYRPLIFPLFSRFFTVLSPRKLSVSILSPQKQNFYVLHSPKFTTFFIFCEAHFSYFASSNSSAFVSMESNLFSSFNISLSLKSSKT